MAAKNGDISITALYTSYTWHWAEFDSAQLFASKQSRDVFNATNAALGLGRLFRPKTPLLRHSLAQRHAIIDHLLAASSAPQVLELAAGLSQRGAAVSRDAAIDYVEVDLPAMIARKRGLLERTLEGERVLARKNLTLVEGDLESVDLAPLIDPTRPVFVIAEGIMMYLQRDQQQALWKRIAELVGRVEGSALVFDLVPFCEQPRAGVRGKAFELILKRFTKGQGFAFDGRTRADLLGELADCGFAEVDLFEPSTVAGDWKLPFAGARTQTLVWRAATA